MKIQLLSMAMMAMAFVSCSNETPIDENASSSASAPIQFSAGVYARVANSQWENNDEVGITATGTAFQNVKYLSNAAGNFTVAQGTDPIAFQNTESMSFTAYYPYSASVGTDGLIHFNTATATQQKNVDFLWAEKKDVPYAAAPTVSFTFVHKMAQIKLDIQSKTTATTGKATQSIVLKGIKHKGEFNTQTGAIAPESNASTTDEWTIGNYEGGNINVTKLIIPQKLETLTLKVGDREQQLTLESAGTGFTSGKSYTIKGEITDQTLKVNITMNGNIIQGWEEDTPSETKTKIAFISSAGNAESFDREAGAAYKWLTSLGKYEVDYISLGSTTASLDAYKMIWVHTDYTNAGLDNTIKTYYAAGGTLLASRKATESVAAWGLTKDGNGFNNSWGNVEEEKDWNTENTMGINVTNKEHALFKGFDFGTESTWMPLRQVSKYHEYVNQWAWNWADTGYSTLEDWQGKTNGISLAEDTQAIRIAEFRPYEGVKGTSIVIGDPAFEWWAPESETDPCLANKSLLTTNAIDYLIGQCAISK